MRALLLQCIANCVTGLSKGGLNSCYVMDGVQEDEVVDHSVVTSRGYFDTRVFEFAGNFCTTQELACRPDQQALDKYPLVVERDRSVRGSLTFLGPARDVLNLHLVRTANFSPHLPGKFPT